MFFWESNFEKEFSLKEQSLKIYFLREQFWKRIVGESDFEDVFFEGAIFGNILTKT